MYFITESQRKKIGGTCYFEFQKGQNNKKHRSVFWKEDSMLLHMDIADKSELYKIIPDFNYYGDTFISREKWNIIKSNAEKETGIVRGIIDEISYWAEENFRLFDYFVIIGI